jgi:hypothetical protein
VNNIIPLNWRVINKIVEHQSSPNPAAKAAFKKEMNLTFLTAIAKQAET